MARFSDGVEGYVDLEDCLQSPVFEPHFRAQYGEHLATIEVVSGAVTTRRFPGKALQLVDHWRERNRDELIADWDRMQRGEAPQPIPPLE